MKRNLSNLSLVSMASYDSANEQPGADQRAGSHGGGQHSSKAEPFDTDHALALCEWLQWEQLYNRFRVVVETKPMAGAHNCPCVRISAQIYNERAEYELLAAAVLQVREEFRAMQAATKATQAAVQAARAGGGFGQGVAGVGASATTAAAAVPATASDAVTAAVAATAVAAKQVARSAAAATAPAPSPPVQMQSPGAASSAAAAATAVAAIASVAEAKGTRNVR